MFVSKRLLKKQKKQYKFYNLAIVISIFLFLFGIIGFVYLFIFSANSTFISPIAKNSTSKVLLIQDVLGSLRINVNSVTIASDNSIRVSLKDGGDVILSPNKDLKLQVSSLQLILSRLTIEGKKLKVLDFRYNSPVITLN